MSNLIHLRASATYFLDYEVTEEVTSGEDYA